MARATCSAACVVVNDNSSGRAPARPRPAIGSEAGSPSVDEWPGAAVGGDSRPWRLGEDEKCGDGSAQRNGFLSNAWCLARVAGLASGARRGSLPFLMFSNLNVT